MQPALLLDPVVLSRETLYQTKLIAENNAILAQLQAQNDMIVQDYLLKANLESNGGYYYGYTIANGLSGGAVYNSIEIR